MNSESKTVLAEVRAIVGDIDVADAGEAELRAVLAEVRAVQRRLDGLVVRIGVRCDLLAAAGAGAPARETMRGDGGVGAHQAAREAGRIEIAQQVGGLIEAASSGQVGGEHVDSIARHARRLPEETRAGFDFEELIGRAEGLPPETFDRLVRRRVDAAIADHGLGDAVAKRASSEFRHWFDDSTGMGRFTGSLDPERYETLVTAIEQHTTRLAAASEGSVAKTPNLAAHALVELVSGSGMFDARNRLPAVTLIVDHDTVISGSHSTSIRQTETGHDLPSEAVARLCCDAVIRKVTLDERSLPLNVGRKYRTATDAQWAAIKAVHSHCAWKQCSAPINWCQAHHIREWDNGGATDLANLVPLCSSHHHRVHEGQWHIKLRPDRSLEILKPDGAFYATAPTPQRC